MKFKRFLNGVLLFLFALAGCKPVDVDILAEQIEAEVQSLELSSTVGGEPDSSEAEIQGKSQSKATPETRETLTPPVTIPTKQPENTTTPTPTLTSTLVVTATTAVSPTVVVSTTQILTNTWDFSELDVVRDGTIYQVSWVDGTLLAAATSLGLYLYQSDDLSPAGSFNLSEPVLSLAYSPDVELLAFGNYNGDIQWQDPFTGEYAATTGGHFMGVTDLVHPDGGLYLISGSDDGTVRTWLPAFVLNQEFLSSDSMDLWRAPDRVTSVDSHPYAPIIAAGSFQGVSIWSPGIDEPVYEIDGLTGWVNDLAISPDGRSLAVVDSSNHLRLWHTETWTLTHDIPIESINQFTALDFSPDGSWIALGAKNGAVLLWAVDDNTVTDPLERYPHPVTDLAFHPYEPLLISSYQDGNLRVWAVRP